MSNTAPNVIAAFTEDQVARLTGISRRQLRYWAADSFFAPSISSQEERFAGLQFYSFRDLVCLKIINSLRNEASISLSELRNTKDRLAGLGEETWAKTTLLVHGNKVVFLDPETGQNAEAATGQGVLKIPLKLASRDMEDAIRNMRRRDREFIGRIERKRAVAQNRPVVAGTKILVQQIQAFHDAGYSIADIQKQYPVLHAEDIEAAIKFKDVA